MKHKLVFVIVFLVCFAGTCKKNPFVERVYSIKVINDSTMPITALLSYQYPDTIIPDNYDRMGGIRPHNFRYFDSQKPWQDVFLNLPKDTLSLFFFTVDTLKTYDWEIIRDKYKILKRYDLSLEDIKQLNWTITFPPTAALRNIKQFPPY